MFWYKKSDQYINEGCQFDIDGVTYPSNWLNQSTPEQKAELGLVEVKVVGEQKDGKYYWTSSVLKDGVETWINTAKDLDQVKSNAVAEVKQATFTVLQPTDYVEARNLRDPNYKADWMAWRDSIRLQSGDAVMAIMAAIDVDDVAAIFPIAWHNDPNYVAPVAEVVAEPKTTTK